MCFLFPVTLEKTWSSQRIGMKTTQQAFFILIFMTGEQRSHIFTSFCEIPRGETLGCHRQQRKNKSHGFRQRPGEHTSCSPCTPACTYCQVQTMGKSRVCVGHRLCRNLSPAPKTVAFIYCFEQGGLLLPNQVQPPCCLLVASQL